MTFAPGTKVRFKTTNSFVSALNGLEGVVTDVDNNTTWIKVTKDSDGRNHGHLLGKVNTFSTSYLTEVEREFKVGDRVKVNDPNLSSHHGLVAVVKHAGFPFDSGTVLADVDESCEAFKALQQRNEELDGKDFYLTKATLELVEAAAEKLKEGGAISYEQVERGQRIRVSYESKGVTHSREGIVGHVSNNRTYSQQPENWTINVLDDEAERYGDKGVRLNWGSAQQKETITLLENAPEVDEVLERLLESKGGTVIRAFENQLLVREAFSDQWKSHSTSKVYSSESLRRVSGGKITFFVEEGK